MGLEVERIKDENGESIYVSKKTGEIIDHENGIFYRSKEISAIKQKEAERECSRRISEIYKDYGRFTWLIFRYCEQLLPDVSGSDLAKLLYLATYIGYDGVIVNGSTAATSAKMMEMLCVSRHTYDNFMENMRDGGVITEDNGKFRVNDGIVFRGKLPKKQADDYIRLNHGGIRRIYVETPPAKHATLSYLYRLIPYVNAEHSILCMNPREKEIGRIEPMTLSQCLKICGAASNSERKATELFQLKCDGKFVIRCLTDNFSDQRQFIIINPTIYYAGSDFKQAEKHNIGVFFNSQL